MGARRGGRRTDRGGAAPARRPRRRARRCAPSRPRSRPARARRPSTSRAKAKMAGSGFITPTTSESTTTCTGTPAPWPHLAHALGGQRARDLARRVRHDAERARPRRWRWSSAATDAWPAGGATRTATTPRAARPRPSTASVGGHAGGQGEPHLVEVPVVVLGGLGVLGPHAGVVGPHDVLGPRVGAEAAQHGRDGGRVGHHEHATRVEQDGVELGSHRSPGPTAQEPGDSSLRFRPARSPRLTNLSAILRDASSIISSPNMTAPLPSSSVARR